MSKLIDLTGQDFGYWYVMYRAQNDKGGKSRWHCKCTACGKEKDVSGGHLRSGRSTNCGCVRMKKMRNAIVKDETGKIYGFLKVIRQATEEEKPRADRYGVYWNCTCLNCGRENVIIFGDYLRNGDTKSCGCITSANESKITEMLQNGNISFKEQYSFPGLLSPKSDLHRLYFDFAILNKDTNTLLYLIEFDGCQHFKYFHNETKFNEGKSWNNRENFEKTRQYDLLKNKYCFEHNIPLIRIPYNVEYNFEDLKLETTRFLLTPENEKEYYKR